MLLLLLLLLLPCSLLALLAPKLLLPGFFFFLLLSGLSCLLPLLLPCSLQTLDLVFSCSLLLLSLPFAAALAACIFWRAPPCRPLGLADIWGLGCPSYCAQPIKAKVRRLFSSGTWEKHCEKHIFYCIFSACAFNKINSFKECELFFCREVVTL